MKKHFVTFFCPGTFFPEDVTREIDSWDPAMAVEMAKAGQGNYGNRRPFAFRFITRERGPDDLDSHVSDHSARYYLGGTIRTVAELRREDCAKHAILISNMEGNDWDRVIFTPYGNAQPLLEGDEVLPNPFA